mmetsp:Transcript_9030/g.26234  ORF Transcript_9030/g.26234 Transcript_9030/m.26234 type:complete len:256 (+) Transcript_9030:4157-4924(+)
MRSLCASSNVSLSSLDTCAPSFSACSTKLSTSSSLRTPSIGSELKLQVFCVFSSSLSSSFGCILASISSLTLSSAAALLETSLAFAMAILVAASALALAISILILSSSACILFFFSCSSTSRLAASSYFAFSASIAACCFLRIFSSFSISILASYSYNAFSASLAIFLLCECVPLTNLMRSSAFCMSLVNRPATKGSTSPSNNFSFFSPVSSSFSSSMPAFLRSSALVVSISVLGSTTFSFSTLLSIFFAAFLAF